MAVKAWEALEKQTDLKLRDLAEEREEECFTFEQITAQPKTVVLLRPLQVQKRWTTLLTVYNKCGTSHPLENDNWSTIFLLRP